MAGSVSAKKATASKTAPKRGSSLKRVPPRRTSQSDLVVRYLVLSFLLLSVALPLILLDPGMPAWGLDPSWVMASATAAAQRLSFGTQTIFTSGPYSPLYTQVYHPATYPLMLLASLYLALASAACIFLLAKDAQRRWMLLLAAAFLFAVGPPDALLFAFPLALGLVAVEVLGKDTPSGQSRWLQYLGVAALFGPLGLLPLVKGSLLVACAFTAIVACAVLAIRRQWGLSALCIASPTVGLLLFWVAIGQKLGGLPAYFSSMSQITAGYAEAMGLSPDPVARSLTGTLFWGYAEMFAFVAVSAFFVVVLARSKDRPLEWRVSASALVAVFLFLAFKAGFVRGGSHIAIATDCLLIAGALLPLLVRSRLSLVATALGVALYVLVTPHYMPASSFQPWKPFTSTLQGLAKAAKPGGLQTRYDDALAAIRANRPISHLNGTSDIYPYDQAELLASGNEWSPRPVLQSYSAYTPSLIELDRRHLLGASAPENLYLTTQAIDGRYPALDDGSSLPIILGSYSPIAAESYFLVTRRVAQPAENNTTLLGRQNGKLGQAVPVPSADSPIFAKIDIQPTLFGKLQAGLYMPSTLEISVTLADGSTHSYRYIAAQGRAGFMLSPALGSTRDVVAIYDSRGKLSAAPNRVVSFDIHVASQTPLDGLDWKPDFSVEFSSIDHVASKGDVLRLQPQKLP